jgi:alkylhydroperoxidase/carboxymuconolactone decarboxylase family protein YurZ
VSEPGPLTPLDYLKQISSETGDAFQALRKAVMTAGPLDARTCELIALGALVTSGGEQSFKTHARRLLRAGVPVASLRQAVLVTLGASTTLNQALNGLRWIEQAQQEPR